MPARLKLLQVLWLALAACAPELTERRQVDPPRSQEPPPPAAPVSGGVAPPEFRAIWVTRWDYSTAEDVRRIMEELAEAGFNAVFFQVRGTADAYYRSNREPWAARLSGKLGRPPGWDPLEVALREARLHGLELHAWVNGCTAWKKGDPPPGPSVPEHPLRLHPEWVLKDLGGKPYADKHGYLYFDPAHAGYRRHLEEVVAEIVANYSPDGIHFDYLRYPEADLPLGREVRALFQRAQQNDPQLTLAAWRRERVASLLDRLTRRARQLHPNIETSAAVIGIRQNLWGWQDVVRGLDDFHQDARLFAELGAVDTLVPMFYWPPTDPPGGRADFLTLARDYASLKGKVRLVAGINLEAGEFEVLARAIAIARQEGFAGTAFFSFALWQKRPAWREKLRQGPWREDAPALTGTARGPK